MNIKYPALTFAFAAFILASCGTKNNGTNEEEVAVNENIIITNEQFQSSGMLLGNPEKMKFEHSVRANGKISASPSGLASVGSLMAGKIKHIAVNVGDRVSKGQLLCTLESTEFIRLQQEYAESAGRLKAVQAEYERQKVLAGDNIASQKIYLNAEGEYKSLLSKCQGLKATLNMLGLSSDKVIQGEIVSTISLYAPIGGYISALHTRTGDYAEPQQSIMEVVDITQLQLNLSVFEKDLAGLSPGLKIHFSSPNNPTKTWAGELLSYSRTINPETKAITVIGSILPSDRPSLINGMYIQAEIFTGDKDVMVLPDEAILKSGDIRLVLVQVSTSGNERKFVKKEVKTGLSSKGFTEILDPKGLKNILVKGGFNLVME